MRASGRRRISSWRTKRRSTSPRKNGSDDVQVRALFLKAAPDFSRRATGGDRGGVDFIEYGPITMPSPIKENPKFMVLSRLHEFYHDPGKAKAVDTVVQKLILRDQSRAMVRLYAKGLLGPEKTTVIRPNDDEDYVIHAPAIRSVGDCRGDKRR